MPSPEELVGQFFKRFDDIDKPSGYVTLPYISGITDALRRKQNIRVATKPLKTLQRMFPSPKQQIAPEQRTNVVYIGGLQSTPSWLTFETHGNHKVSIHYF